MAYINLVLDGSKLLLSSSQLRIGLAQSLTLRLHLTVNLIELDNVQNPGAQAGRCVRLGGHEIWLELWVLVMNGEVHKCRMKCLVKCRGLCKCVVLLSRKNKIHKYFINKSIKNRSIPRQESYVNVTLVFLA